MTDTTTDAPARRVARRGHTRLLNRSLVVSAALLVVFVVYSWLAATWGPFIRLDHALNRNFHVQSLWPELHFFDRVGQRVLCLKALAVIIALTAWRRRTLRPVLLGVLGVFLVNLLVLIVKLALSRGAPLSGQSFFADGDLYPSGHTSNVVVVYGLGYYLLTHYLTIRRWVRRALLASVFLAGAIQFTTSLLLRWHWFSDLIGGYLIGGVVLALMAGLDTAVPRRPRGSHRPRRQHRREAVAPADQRLELAEVSPGRTPDDSHAAAEDRRSRR